MNRKKYSIFIIMYTIFNIGVLMGAEEYIEQSYRSQYNSEKEVNSNIMDSDIDNDTNSQSINIENQNKNEKIAQNNAENQISTSENSKKYGQNIHESDKEVSDYTTSYNYGSSTRVNSSSQYRTKVFKATADEIISDLNTVEKAKILWVCRKLTKEEYNEIEEYLSYRNEKLGIMKVYAILEKKLDEESLEEVKDIFSKYIDTDKVKEIYY